MNSHHTDILHSFKASHLGLKSKKGETWYVFNDPKKDQKSADLKQRFPTAKIERISKKEHSTDLLRFKLGAYAEVKGDWYFCNAGKDITQPKKIKTKVFSIRSWGAGELLDKVIPELKIDGSTYVFNIVPAYATNGYMWCAMYDKIKDEQPTPDFLTTFSNKNLANAIIGLAERCKGELNLNIFQ